MAILGAALEPENTQERSPLGVLSDEERISLRANYQPGYVSRMALLAALGEVDMASDTPVNDLNELADTYRTSIGLAGDLQARRRAAVLETEERMGALAQLRNETMAQVEPAQELVQGATAAAAKLLQEDIDNRAKYALEQRAINRINDLAANGDWTQAQVAMSNIELGNAEQVRRDIQAKRMILDSHLRRLEAEHAQQPWFRDLVDFVFLMAPLNNSMSGGGLVDAPNVVKEWGDWILNGRRKRNEAASLYNLPLEDFARLVPQVLQNIDEHSTFLGYNNNTEQLNLLRDLRNTPSTLETNAWNTLDNVGLVPFGMVAKGVRVSDLMLSSGALKQAREALASVAVRAQTEGLEKAAASVGMTADEVIDQSLPTIINPEPAPGPMRYAGPIAVEANAIQETVSQVIPELQASHRFSDLKELTDVYEANVKRLQEEFGRVFFDVRRTYENVAGDRLAYNIEVTFGRSTGKSGFASEASARSFVKKNGFADAEVFQSETGQWFVRKSFPMIETGLYTHVTNPKATNWIGRMISGARQIADDFIMGEGLVAGDRRARIQASLAKFVRENFAPLSGNERARLMAVLEKGRDEKVWFDERELHALYTRAFGREASEAEVKAYNAFRLQNDIEYYARNDHIYLSYKRKGAEEVSFRARGVPIERGRALIDRTMRTPQASRVYDITEDYHILDPREKWDAMKEAGYIHVSLLEPIRLTDGTTIKHFVGRAADFEASNLSRMQLPYVPGGHRMYADKWFVKQARRGMQPDTGQDFLLNPRVFMTGTKAELAEIVQDLEAARKLYKELNKKVDDLTLFAQLDEILQGPGRPDVDTFVKALRSDEISADDAFELLYDRQNPEIYYRKNVSTSDLADPDEEGFQGWLRTTGRMYTGHKGEQLSSPEAWNNHAARLLDPFKTIDISLRNITNTIAFGDFRDMAIERWVDKWYNYLDTALDKESASRSVLFWQARLNETARNSPRIGQTMEAERDIIKRIVGHRSDGDFYREQQARELLEWVAGSDPHSRRFKSVMAAGEWWVEKNPVQAVRQFAFDLKMGFFNPAHLFLNIATAIAATAINPKYGMQGMANIGPLFLYLGRQGSDDILDTMARNGVSKLAGYADANEWRVMMQSAKTSGFFDIAYQDIMRGEFGPTVGSALGRHYNDVAEAGRWFYNKGEVANRAVAWNIAWRETREMWPDADFTTGNFLRRVRLRADDYSFNMSRESAAAWQRGIASIPTQFWAYNVRMIEAMVGRQFTLEQKLRLIVGQAIMYGSAGVPLVGLASDALEAKQGEAFQIGTVAGALDRGLFDSMIYAVAEQDVALGARFGTGTWLGDLIKDITGSSAYGPKSALDIVGGATLGIMGQLATDLVDVVKYSVAESGGETGRPLTAAAVEGLAKNISSYSNFMKAYYIYAYGQWRNNSNNVQVDDLPREQAWAALLGAQPGQTDDLSAAFAYLRNDKKAVDEAAKIISAYRTRALQNPSEREQVADEVNLYVRLLPPHIRTRALQQAHRNTPDSLYNNVREQLERRRGQNERIKEIAEQQEPNG